MYPPLSVRYLCLLLGILSITVTVVVLADGNDTESEPTSKPARTRRPCKNRGKSQDDSSEPEDEPTCNPHENSPQKFNCYKCESLLIKRCRRSSTSIIECGAGGGNGTEDTVCQIAISGSKRRILVKSCEPRNSNVTLGEWFKDDMDMDTYQCDYDCCNTDKSIPGMFISSVTGQFGHVPVVVGALYFLSIAPDLLRQVIPAD